MNLERELLSRVAKAHPKHAGATLIVTPTTRLVAHLQRRLTKLRSAWLGLEVVNFTGLAHRILETHEPHPYRILSPQLLDALLQRALEADRQNPWNRWVAERPGWLPRLRRSLNDLRESGLGPRELRKAADSERTRALVPLYQSYVAALEQLHLRGYVDPAGLILAALPHAASFAKPYRSCWLHGAYEWLGVHRDLVFALDRGTDVTVLLPHADDLPVAEFGRAFAASLRKKPKKLPEPLEIEQRMDLGSLFCEERRPRPAAPDRCHFRHARGEAAEVKVAVREALSAIARGVDPGDIAITARSLTPYASALEEALDDAGIPWTSSLATPLLRQPLIRDFLQLLSVVAGDFPRRATAELLRSPRIRWSNLLDGGAPPAGTLADVWSRRARLLGGLEEWVTELPRWAGEPTSFPNQSAVQQAEAQRRANERRLQTERIADALKALQHCVNPEPRSWSQHAERLNELLDSAMVAPDEADAVAAVEALQGLLTDMEHLERVCGLDEPVGFRAMQEWLDQAVQTSELTLRKQDCGGIQVLDVMQLRGLTFRHIHMLGLNDNLFPANPQEDPVLDDRVRRRLAESTGKPLTVKAQSPAEERLLLAQWLGAAEERVDVSWQRADESGRAKTPSLALREVARVALGYPVSPDQLGPRHLASHPAHWLEDLVQRPGLLAPNEAELLTILNSGGARVIDLSDYPALAPGLTLLRATQPFAWADTSYDARIDAGLVPETLSVSSLETLGSCPLKFFFQRVLRVDELDRQADVLEIRSHDVGVQIHRVLEQVYRTLADEGHFESGDGVAAAERATELLSLAESELLGHIGRRLARRLPVLHRHLLAAWLTSLVDFVQEDVSSLVEEGWKLVELESLVETTLDCGEDVFQPLRGRFDRRFERGERVSIGDYKTAGNLKRRANATKILKAETLQVPLYRMLAGGDAEVELIGVGPDYPDDGPERRIVFRGMVPEKLESGWLETLRVLVRLRQSGTFPFHSGLHCEWCAYDLACRRYHPPTIEREKAATDGAEFRALKRKNHNRPLLDISRS